LAYFSCDVVASNLFGDHFAAVVVASDVAHFLFYPFF
jgi:predicted naringenin-chalcone synthase